MTTPPPQDPGHAPHPDHAHGPPRDGGAGGPAGPGHGPGGRPGPGPAPGQLKRLLGLTLVSAALYLLNGIVALVLITSLDVTGIYRRMGFPPEQAAQAGAMAERSADLSVVSSIVTVTVALGLYTLVYVYLRQGANWARVLGIVLAAYSCLSFLFTLISSPWLYGSWAVLPMATGAAVLVVNVLWILTAIKTPLRAWFYQHHPAAPRPAPGGAPGGHLEGATIMSTPAQNPHHRPGPSGGAAPWHSSPAGPHGPRSGYRGGPGPAPRQLKRLLALTVASGVLYLALGVVVTVIFTTMDFAAMYQRMGVPAADAQQVGTMVEQMRGLSLASGLVTLAVLAGLYAMEYVFLGRGANWARILGIVLAILSAVVFAGNLFGFWLYGQWAIVLAAIGIAFIAVNITWLVTAFQAPLRQWFTRPRPITGWHEMPLEGR